MMATFDVSCVVLFRVKARSELTCCRAIDQFVDVVVVVVVVVAVVVVVVAAVRARRV